ncbi:hypothetical protein LOD99_3507 [Oopsacas minuta]|uniref:Uncharacterized protein n=1 Tax=Oopsacas minuta TaxID=111878 RepID=A0AAV7JXG9_9METZ|nr:hypothetical protein LOD99_3507 [Oopsacas minuta]
MANSKEYFNKQPTQSGIKDLIEKKLIQVDLDEIYTPPVVRPIVFTENYVSNKPKEFMQLGSIVQSNLPNELIDQSSLITNESWQKDNKSLDFEMKINKLKLEKTKNVETKNVFLNINDPWCMIAVGIQGAGKSHTLMKLVESCSIQLPDNKLQFPMTSLICHYDPDLSNYCEAATLALYPSADVHVIVPPDMYNERKKFYSSLPMVKIHPLLFQFKKLSIDHIRKLMTVDAGENILYMQILTNILRKYQKNGEKLTSINQLWYELNGKNSVDNLQKQQLVPLKQRIALLQSFLAGEAENNPIQLSSKASGNCIEDISELFELKGAILILDLSNPLMDQSEVCSVSNIFVDMFVHHKVDHGKLLCFDEAHKFLSKYNELANTIVISARELRHHGLRLLVSTQNPDILPDELIELSSLAVLHQIFSPRWIKFLQARYPLSNEIVKSLEGLSVGQAIIYSPRAAINSPIIGSEIAHIQVSGRQYSSSGSKLNSS